MATSRRYAAKLSDVITGTSVGGLAGGATQGGLDTSNLGSFSETLSFDVESSNSSLYDQVIGSVTFAIEGDRGVGSFRTRARYVGHACFWLRYAILRRPPAAADAVKRVAAECAQADGSIG